MRANNTARALSLALLVLVVSVLGFVPGASCTEVSYDERALVIDGQRRIILSGSIHYPRSTPEVMYTRCASSSTCFKFF